MLETNINSMIDGMGTYWMNPSGSYYTVDRQSCDSGGPFNRLATNYDWFILNHEIIWLDPDTYLLMEAQS